LPIAVDLLSKRKRWRRPGMRGDRHHDEQLRSVSFWGIPCGGTLTLSHVVLTASAASFSPICPPHRRLRPRVAHSLCAACRRRVRPECHSAGTPGRWLRRTAPASRRPGHALCSDLRYQIIRSERLNWTAPTSAINTTRRGLDHHPYRSSDDPMPIPTTTASPWPVRCAYLPRQFSSLRAAPLTSHTVGARAISFAG